MATAQQVQVMATMLETMKKMLEQSNDGSRAPKAFKGDMRDAERFLQACEVYFTQKDAQYSGNHKKKILYALSICEEKAGTWATPIVKDYLEGRTPYATWDDFKDEFLKSFGSPDPASDARFEIEKLRQGEKSVAEYTATFALLSGRTGFGDTELREKYKRGLNYKVREKMATSSYDTYAKLRDAALLIERNMRDMGVWEGKRQFTNFAPRPSYTRDPYAMQVDATSSQRPPRQPGILPVRSDDWQKEATCFGCGKKGHIKRGCKENPQYLGRRNWNDNPQNPRRGNWNDGTFRLAPPRPQQVRATITEEAPTPEANEGGTNWEERCHALEAQMGDMIRVLEEQKDF
jgi:hypothetical protein